MRKVRVALVGNPNSGKSTLFNCLTGSKQSVGNWPGVTVEKRQGLCEIGECVLEVVDLPGVYGLAAFSPEEAITRDYLLEKKVDVVVCVLDAVALKRHLYLLTQVLELDIPVVVALNMFDEAKRKGIRIHIDSLSEFFSVPIIPTVAITCEGREELLKAILRVLSAPKRERFVWKDWDEVVYMAEEVLPGKGWFMVERAREGDEGIQDKLLEFGVSVEVDESAMAERYTFVEKCVGENVVAINLSTPTLSDRLDQLFTNPVMGFPAFGIVMGLLFWGVFVLSAPFSDWIGIIMDVLRESIVEMVFLPLWVRGLLGDGVIGGVGAVLGFFPTIFFLFLFLSILEESGYMARIAFLMDPLMHRIGLHSRSFIPLLLGFGCNVPGIMATRTIETGRDRLITILVNPLISCSARLPVYLMIASAFAPSSKAIWVLSLYLLGTGIAVLSVKIFGNLLFGPLRAPFVIELPPYRMPSLWSVWRNTWSRASEFLKKAGGIILLLSVVIWLVGSLPPGVEYGGKDSWAGKIGKFFTPVLSPLGFDEWETGMALLSGFVAKEMIIATFGTLYGSSDIGDVLRARWSKVTAYAFCVFVLLYIPCVATVIVMLRETGSVKWTFLGVTYTLALAWVMAFVVKVVGGLIWDGL